MRAWVGWFMHVFLYVHRSFSLFPFFYFYLYVCLSSFLLSFLYLSCWILQTFHFSSCNPKAKTNTNNNKMNKIKQPNSKQTYEQTSQNKETSPWLQPRELYLMIIIALQFPLTLPLTAIVSARAYLNDVLLHPWGLSFSSPSSRSYGKGDNL